MRKLELKIEKCGDCPYLEFSDYNDGYHCARLWDGGTEHKVRYNELDDDCPLPVYIEGQKEIF